MYGRPPYFLCASLLVCLYVYDMHTAHESKKKGEGDPCADLQGHKFKSTQTNQPPRQQALVDQTTNKKIGEMRWDNPLAEETKFDAIGV
mmetsp:Transcript_46239/g.91204  ORF Transcript_46239/g.91204 Transcript_46239/m.91204 type:complete len:89 (+) Transcript_46239:407-673(+)